ncbi:hypothetical protein DSOL_5150 [Desulfosporosinus metallidurans]|uniref:Uncharacterized protein n=1 Tax=Desulfosporosinus metallidurans TaxID=1888891 RepID=A0A1Q8QFF2_9FIRM|nr:hypothetical protein DSOL_5150 [Desulfosporosinus metallidurans]
MLDHFILIKDGQLAGVTGDRSGQLVFSGDLPYSRFARVPKTKSVQST